MATSKIIVKILDDLSPSAIKLRSVSRPPEGLHNMFINEVGQVEKREGFAKYNTDSIGASHAITGLHRFYNESDDSKEFLASWNTKIYSLASAAGHAATALKSKAATDYTHTADAETHFANYGSHSYIANDADAVAKYNGTYVRSVGITVPTACTVGVDSLLYYTGGYAVNLNSTVASGSTYIASVNAATRAGKVDQVQIYCATKLEGVKVATFDEISTNVYTARDVESIDDVTAGATQVFTVDLDVEVGDYIGIYFTGGTLDASTASGGSMKSKAGDQTACSGATFSSTSGTSIAIRAYIVGPLTAGTYYHKITYVDEDGYESNGGTASAGLTLTTSTAHYNGLNLSSIPVSTDDKVEKRRVYRTTVDGAIYYYIGEIDDNTTTTYDDTTADASVGSALSSNHEAPPSGSSLITKRRSRIILANDDDLCISDISDIEYFPAAWFIETGNGQDITGLCEQLSALPTFTNNSIERLIGSDEDNFEFTNAYSDYGCYAPRSVAICDNLVVYLSYKGICYFDGETSGYFSERLNKYLRDNINYTYIQKAAAVYYNGLYLLSYPKGDSTVNSETVYIDLANKTTGVYNYAFHCYSKWERMGDGNQLYGGSTSIGRVYRLGNSVTTDDTAAIAAYDKTDFMDFGYPERWKQFYHLYIKVKSTTGTALRFYYTLDDASETYKDLTLTANKTLWYKIDLAGGGQYGRAIQLRPYMSDAYDAIFQGYAVVFDMEEEEYS